MQRAGAEGTPVFLVGGKPEVLAQTESSAASALAGEHRRQPGRLFHP